MRLITPTDPEQLRPDTEGSDSAPKSGGEAPLSFVPRDENGDASRPPVRIRTNRYGDLEEHELIHLLDSIEDERARSRFRESIYISLFIWIAIAWLVLYGPRYLWHAPKLVTPFEVLKERELTQLNMPQLHAPPPSVPRAQPKLDNRTLEHLRAMAKAAPPPPPAPTEAPKVAPTPAPSIANAAPPTPAPALPLPNAPQPTARKTPPVVAEAPTPQPNAKPNFNANSASNSISEAERNAAKNPGGGGYSPRGASGPLAFGPGGPEILSDTEGVNFDPYLRRLIEDIRRNWLPLIPEECRPPLSKQGETLVRFKILPDGRIGGMWLDGSTHDDAINRSAWGSITSEGQFPPLPSQFHGPDLELRIHYYVNKQPE